MSRRLQSFSICWHADPMVCLPAWKLNASDLLLLPVSFPQHTAPHDVRPSESPDSGTWTCLRGIWAVCHRCIFSSAKRTFRRRWAPEPKHVTGPARGGQPLGKHRIIGRPFPHRGALHPPRSLWCDKCLGNVPHLRSMSTESTPSRRGLTSTGPSLVFNLTVDAYDASCVVTPDVTQIRVTSIGLFHSHADSLSLKRK